MLLGLILTILDKPKAFPKQCRPYYLHIRSNMTYIIYDQLPFIIKWLYPN